MSNPSIIGVYYFRTDLQYIATVSVNKVEKLRTNNESN